MTEFERLMEVQRIDTRVGQLRHRLTHDVTRDQLATVERAFAELERRIARHRSDLDAVRSVQRSHERAAADLDAKITKENGVLYGGSVTSPKELEALQHEIATLTRMRTGSEDLVLEQMELAEPIEAELEDLGRQLETAGVEVQAAAEAVTVMEAEVGVELDAVLGERAGATEGLSPALVASYERIKADLGGTAVARLAAGGKCEGCHLTLARAEYDQIKRAPDDALVNCPECGRILVR